MGALLPRALFEIASEFCEKFLAKFLAYGEVSAGLNLEVLLLWVRLAIPNFFTDVARMGHDVKSVNLSLFYIGGKINRDKLE